MEDYRADPRKQLLQGLCFPSLSRAFPLTLTPTSSFGELHATQSLPFTQLWEISLPRHRPPFTPRLGSTKPQASARGHRGWRRGRGGLVTPPPPSQPSCWGQWQERRTLPAARGVGCGRQKRGRRLGSEPTAHFKRLWGCASLLRPGNFKAAGTVPAPSSALWPRSASAAAWWP